MGTIGGGIMEKKLIESARRDLLQSDVAPKLSTLFHRDESHSPSGLICGGQQKNVNAILYPKTDTETIERFVEAIETQSPLSLKIDSQNGIELASCQTTSTHALLENSASWSFALAAFNPRRILIFGAGHCGQATAAQFLRLGYHVTVSDQRSANEIGNIRIEKNSVHTDSNPEEFLAEFDHIASTQVIVMTHSYPTDFDTLAALLRNPPPFIGLMGSPPKFKRIFDQLIKSGISQETVARITAPVGLPIGSDTPEEIAVSIAAQILLERNIES